MPASTACAAPTISRRGGDPADGPPAACSNSWVWLGAAGQATSRVSLGTAVTSLVHRYNPVVVAQQVATLDPQGALRTYGREVLPQLRG